MTGGCAKLPTMTDTPTQAPGRNRAHQKGGPDAEAIVSYLQANPDRPLSIELISTSTNVPYHKVSDVLAARARKTERNQAEHLMVFRPIQGMVRRVKLGVYFLDTKGSGSIDVPERPTQKAPAKSGGGLEHGILLEVIRAYDNGRVILACEQGFLYTGTLTKAEC